MTALAIEARRAATLGAVHESAGPQDNAQRMAAQIHTLLSNGNGSHTLNLARIARFQGFDPDDFRVAFLLAETRASLTPSNFETVEAE